jgi:hypothetical protein
MTAARTTRNRALLFHIVLPLLFLTVVLTGGLRVSGDTKAILFVPPPLVSLILAALLMTLFVRGGLINVSRWLSLEQSSLAIASNTLLLVSLFFAAAQAFNSVLPETGLLFWLFSFFFLWTLWNSLFSSLDARRLVRSVAVLFATAFAIKHMLLAGIYAPEGSWQRRLLGIVLEGVSLGSLDSTVYAPVTGYISFFTLALFIIALMLTPSSLESESDDGPGQRALMNHNRRAELLSAEAVDSEIFEADDSEATRVQKRRT